MKRRRFLELSGGFLLGTSSMRLVRPGPADVEQQAAHDLAAIERQVAGRLGVAALDVTTGRNLAYRATERFPMCSTFKCLLAAQVLRRIDRDQESLERTVPYRASDLLAWAPITRRHVAAGGMSVSALLAAALEYSDNTAANLLLASVNGPGGLTAFLRKLGDPVTRLDRTEPDLNSSIPGDPRDTTTPAAMVADLRRVLLGNVLSAGSRDRLADWLRRNTTGAEKLRAGFPGTWRVGDKTGSGPHGTTNDVAIAWPESGAPFLVAAYLTNTRAPADARNAALAGAGRVVGQWAGAARH